MLQVHDITFGLDPVLRRPATRVVLAGCGLRCSWCDVPETFYGGSPLSIDEIVAQVRDAPLPRAVVSGGEPLEQPACRALLEALVGADCETWLDTSGTRSLAGLPKAVRRMVDVKCPGSRMADRNRESLAGELQPGDLLQFTLLDRHDFEWAKAWIQRHALPCPVILQPVRGELDPLLVADWVIDDGLDAVVAS